MEREDTSWYVAIMRVASGYTPFIAAGGESYRNFRDSAKRTGIDIVAEQFGVTDVVVDRLSPGGNASTTPLTILVEKLAKGKDLDVQKELSKLCEAI